MVDRSNAPPLIVTRTPLRVSFAGGGTDLAEFYERDYGAVFSATISNYIYVTLKPHSPLFNEPIRVNYSKSEEVMAVGEIENDIVRECLRFLDIGPPIYISTVGDHPTSAGLGGSSSFAVGLLNALHVLRGERVSAGQLAEEAAHIEIDVLGHPIGKQDQYAAAFGGLNFFSFRPGGAVTVEPERVPNGALENLFEHMIMFWTGHQPETPSVLAEQRNNTSRQLDSLRQMRGQAHALHQMMTNGPVDPIDFGRVLHEAWQLKRGLSPGITNERLDRLYERALEAGAAGGKILGAGGGGCFLFIVSPERRQAVQSTLSELTEVPIGYEVHGSRVLLPPGQ
jgi:D-glycero-alpha-D-manno-heptose-7-phosphate kinase